MMKQVLIFHTGDTTCSEKPSYPGSICPFVYARNFGTQPVCHLYDDAPLDDVDGWLQRRPECMANHRGAHDMSNASFSREPELSGGESAGSDS